jgi:ATP-dependent RNA helicase DeaD
LFINIGVKDGISSNEKLLSFITDSSDIEPGQIDRITVRDLSSFFNVSGSAADYIIQTLSSRKYKGRKVRIEEAEQRDRERQGNFGGGRGQNRDYSGGSKSYGGGRGRGENRSEGGREGREGRGGSQKFNKRY